MPSPIDLHPAVKPYKRLVDAANRLCLHLNAMDRPPASLLDLAVETQQEAERQLAIARRAQQVRADLAAAEELALEDYEPTAFREWQADVEDVS